MVQSEKSVDYMSHFVSLTLSQKKLEFNEGKNISIYIIMTKGAVQIDHRYFSKFNKKEREHKNDNETKANLKQERVQNEKEIKLIATYVRAIKSLQVINPHN